MSLRPFWPPAEAAQVDYEALRGQLLRHGVLPDGLTAARFDRRGLAGLITWPVSEPVYLAEFLGASRPPWSPHADPRLDVLAAGYQFLLDAADPLVAAGANGALARSDAEGGVRR